MTGKQLKNSILQWAIQGKLVPQDPNDEPASVLLEKIRAEKARLIKEGKIKKDKKESIIYRDEDNSYYEKFADGKVVCIDDELPFAIPFTWEWVRLRSITSLLGDGIHGTPEYDNNGSFFFINGNNLKEKSIIIKPDTKKVNEKEYLKYKKDLNETTVLVSINGTLGNIAFYNDEPVMLGKSACYFNLIFKQLKDYIYHVLNSPYFLEYALSAATGTTIKNVSLQAMNNLLIPFPSTTEQSRIVNKIELLSPILGKYSKQEIKLNRLNSSIKQVLKKSVLQEAIQGKLVLQDASEEPASILLQHIKEEKNRLVKEGKLKKKDVIDSTIFRGDDNKYYEQIGQEIVDITDDVPFDLPDNWQWVRFGQIVRMCIGKTPARGDVRYWTDATKPWVSISDMADYGHINNTKEKISNTAAASIMGSISPIGSLLMSFKLTVGRTSILDIDAYHNEAIISIYPFIDEDFALRDYLFYTLPVLSNMGDSKDAIKGKTLNSKSLNSLLIPLPPLKEQRHIINRLEELYAHL